MDPEYLKRAQRDLDKLNMISEMDNQPQKQEDNRSMLEIMKEKRMKAE